MILGRRSSSTGCSCQLSPTPRRGADGLSTRPVHREAAHAVLHLLIAGSSWSRSALRELVDELRAEGVENHRFYSRRDPGRPGPARRRPRRRRANVAAQALTRPRRPRRLDHSDRRPARRRPRAADHAGAGPPTPVDKGLGTVEVPAAVKPFIWAGPCRCRTHGGRSRFRPGRPGGLLGQSKRRFASATARSVVRSEPW